MLGVVNVIVTVLVFRPWALGPCYLRGGEEELLGAEKGRPVSSFLKAVTSEKNVALAQPQSDLPVPPLSSHNWNTLFMGPNAVADAIAQKYSATKSQVFDHVSERPV